MLVNAFSQRVVGPWAASTVHVLALELHSWQPPLLSLAQVGLVSKGRKRAAQITCLYQGDTSVLPLEAPEHRPEASTQDADWLDSTDGGYRHGLFHCLLKDSHPILASGVIQQPCDLMQSHQCMFSGGSLGVFETFFPRASPWISRSSHPRGKLGVGTFSRPQVILVTWDALHPAGR